MPQAPPCGVAAPRPRPPGRRGRGAPLVGALLPRWRGMGPRDQLTGVEPGQGLSQCRVVTCPPVMVRVWVGVPSRLALPVHWN